MRSIQIKDSYKTWKISTMKTQIDLEMIYKPIIYADRYLNRTYVSMYIEWWLHNIGYYLTLPFIKNPKIYALNLRFKDVDLEEHS